MEYIYVIIAFASYLALLGVNINKFMHIFQQSFYEMDEFLPALKTTKSLKIRMSEVILLVLGILSMFNIYALIPYSLVAFIAAYQTVNHRVIAKKKFVYTNRVKITYGIMGIVFLALIILVSRLSKVSHIEMMFIPLSLYKLIAVSALLIGNFISRPILKMCNKKYIKEAREIISSNKKLKVIGITGSYGKTSTKNIVTALLEEKFITVMTPKSFNTTLGVVRSIREQIKPYTEVFVCEMGAARLGEIKEICEIVPPDISVITSIGPQHLTSFKSMDNIQKGKYEILTYAKEKAKAILNVDNEYIKDGIGKYSAGKEIIEYSINNSDARYTVDNIRMSEKGSIFNINDGISSLEVETKLLGKHNIYNIVCAVAIAKELGMTNEEIKRGIKKIKPVEHRLELKIMGGILALDDSFNSNPEGSKAAIETLCMFKDKYKVLVTPGMIELGEKTDELNEKFGEYASSLDYVILVGKITTEKIVKGLENKGFKDYIVVEDLYDAFAKLKEIQVSHNNILALFENDLPDSYIERK